jgi:type 1 glutamine amidotransferase
VQYRVVVFLNTTGDIFNPGEQAAFERFVQRGGGFVGIHAASDTAIGHTAESYKETLVLEHLLGGITWAAGVTPQ